MVVSQEESTRLGKIRAAADFVAQSLPQHYKQLKLGIICGSGLSKLTFLMSDTVSIEYTSIPHFPKSTVVGHGNMMVVGMLNGVPTMSLLGRFHYYEGYDIEDTVLPVRVMALLGIKNLLITNAAGGVDKSFKPGDIMVIEDHISLPNLAGISPLRGPNIAEFGVRFPSLCEPYERRSYNLIKEAAKSAGIAEDAIKIGTYVCQFGPAYETRAEVRFLRTIGGSAAGMSTIPEVVVAVHAGIKVIAFSLIANKMMDSENLDDIGSEAEVTHEEVLATATQRSQQLESMVYHLAPMI